VLQPLVVHIEDMSVLPLSTLSRAPPAHCVPAHYELAPEFQAELHCHIAALQTPMSPGTPVPPAIVPVVMDVVDPDLKVGLGLTPKATGLGLITPPQLVRQRSRISPTSSSPLVPKRILRVNPSQLFHNQGTGQTATIPGLNEAFKSSLTINLIGLDGTRNHIGLDGSLHMGRLPEACTT